MQHLHLLPSLKLVTYIVVRPPWIDAPPAAPSMLHYYVVVREILTAEPVRGGRRCWNPFRLSSGSCNGLLFFVTHSLLSLRLFFFFFFSLLPRSHREAADQIEAVASRAVRASKQTFGFLMDLLQDNSTEEYIRNLTERWEQQPLQTHTDTQTHTRLPLT